MSGKRPIVTARAGKAKVKRAKAVAKAAGPKTGQAKAGKTAAKPKAAGKHAQSSASSKLPAAVAPAKIKHAATQAPATAKVAPVVRGSLRAGMPSKPQRTRAAQKLSKPKSAVALARFSVGDVVRHKFYPFRGVIFDIDPVFANTDDWWLSIPEQMRPKKNQPFYHLLAENTETEYIAYVSEQNLLPDTTGVPVRHPQVAEYFVEDEDGRYRPVFMTMLN